MPVQLDGRDDEKKLPIGSPGKHRPQSLPSGIVPVYPWQGTAVSSMPPKPLGGAIYSTLKTDGQTQYWGWDGTAYFEIAASVVGAPQSAEYVVITLDGVLTAERRLQVGSGLTLVDSGPNDDVTLDLAFAFKGAGYIHHSLAVDGNYTGSDEATITTAGESTTKMFSTIQAAVTHAETLNTDITIYIAAGSYNEDVTIPTGFGGGDNLTFIGEGQDVVNWGNAASGNSLTIADGSPVYRFYGINFRGGSGGYSVIGTATNIDARFFDCRFTRKISGDWAGAVFSYTNFNGGYFVDSGHTPATVIFSHCDFGGTTSVWSGNVQDHYFDTCNFGSANEKITTDSTFSVVFNNCTTGTSGSGKIFFDVLSGGGGGTLQFSGCDMGKPGSTSGIIHINSGASAGIEVIISGSILTFFTGQATWPHINAEREITLSLVGNSLDDADQPSVVGSYVDSVFGPNIPADFDIDVTAGSGNVYHGLLATLTGETGTTKIPGEGGLDATAIHDNVASEISAITVKGTPVDADFIVIEDSAAGNVKKHITIGSLGAGHGTGTVVDAHGDVDTVSSAPALNEVLKWDGTNWVPGLAGDTTEFTFTLDSFTGSGVGGTDLIGLGDWKAIGAISFDAGYTNPPGGMTADVALTGSASPWAGDLAMTGTPPDGPTTNTEAVEWPGARTGTLTFTLTPDSSPTPATRQDSISFTNTMRYGNSSLTQGNQTEASIEALTEVSGPNESRSQTINNIPTTAAKLVFGYGDALSKPSQVQMNSGNGYVTAAYAAASTTLAPDEQTGITNVANSNSFSETFAAITSLDSGLADGSNDFKLLTSSAALNYLMWGEVAVASTADGAKVYTEANVEDNTGRGDILSSNSISSRNMEVTGGDNSLHAYIAYPARLGDLTNIIIGGFESITDFWQDANSGNELAITNDAGYTENYYVYVAKNPGFGAGTIMVVSL